MHDREGDACVAVDGASDGNVTRNELSNSLEQLAQRLEGPLLSTRSGSVAANFQRHTGFASEIARAEGRCVSLKRRVAWIGHNRSVIFSRLFSAHLLPDDPGNHAPLFALQQGLCIDTPKQVH
jgi:hypothetical protein